MLATTQNVALARAAFAFEQELVRAEASAPPALVSAGEALARLLARWLASAKDGVLSWAAEKLPKTAVRKADPPPLPPVDDLYEEISRLLVSSSHVGAAAAAASTGIELYEAPPTSVLAAQQRAAELVGRRLVGGVLVDNPNPQYAITETLRADVNELVSQAVAEGWSPQELTSALDAEFAPARAETIARTETGYAYGRGAHAVYQDAGVAFVMILDGDGCLPSGHDDNAPAPSGEPGVVEENAQADGQIWTLDQFAAHLLGHPNCVRSTAAWSPQED